MESDDDLGVGGDLVLFGFVGDRFQGEGFTAEGVRRALANVSGDVTVRVNSGGGSAFDGEAIRAALAGHDGRVTVMVEGVAASAASLIAMAGDEIVMSAGAVMMIHDPSMLTIGNSADHMQSAGVLEKLADSYASVYAARIGRSKEDARQMMRDETWMTAAEAVSMGFADRVEGDEKVEAVSPFDFTLYQNAPDRLAAVAAMRGWRFQPTESAEPALHEKEPIMAANEEPAVQPVEMTAGRDAAPDAGKILAEERARAKGIRTAVAALSLPASLADEMIDQGVSLDAARERIIEAKAKAGDAHEYAPRPAATVTADARDRFAEGATLAIMAKAGMKGGERNEFTGMSLLEMARHSVEVSGDKVNATSKLEVAGAAFGVRMAGGHSTSDFPAILENVANKAMLRGFDEQEETFELWTSRGSMPDFKQAKRVGVDAFPALAKIAEDAEYTYASIGDYGEPVVLATYGKMFKITRQAIVNDDLDAFTRIPMKMGRAARRTVGNLAYAVLTGNPAMSDGTALFHADHANLAGSAGAPSVVSMETALAAMATQKDRSDNATALNIRPSFIIAPFALQGTINQLLLSEYDPAKSTRAANTVRNAVVPIFDARLDAASTSAWYLSASPTAGDTVEISYLDGQDQPFLDSKDGWSVDGVEFKVRIDAAATPLAWEGLYKNAG